MKPYIIRPQFSDGLDVSTRLALGRFCEDVLRFVNRTQTLPTYADNASAISGGLEVGELYKTSTGVVMVVY